MLEDLLWESQQQQQQQQQQQRQRQQPPLSIDYYSFVKEIVESPARRPADSLAGILGRTLTFREVFGAKIKRAKLSTAHHDLLEPSIKFLSHLEELFLDDFDESGRNQCSEWMYETVEVALKTHQSLFPGRLRKIVYKIEELYGHPRRSDPKMMLLIRKVMDGQWCTDELILDLPEEIDQDYLMVLKDEELPKLVRDLQIYHTGREVCEIHWVQPLEMFVSRCRKE